MDARPQAAGQPPSPASPASPYRYPGLRISGFTPRILVGAKAMLPLGNRNKCPVNTPFSAPRGLNMQREFCWEPPSNQLLYPWGGGVSVDTQNHCHAPFSYS